MLKCFYMLTDVEMFVNQAGQPLPYQQTSENKPANTFRYSVNFICPGVTMTVTVDILVHSGINVHILSVIL